LVSSVSNERRDLSWGECRGRSLLKLLKNRRLAGFALRNELWSNLLGFGDRGGDPSPSCFRKFQNNDTTLLEECPNGF
jgi:hypothetical protein